MAEDKRTRLTGWSLEMTTQSWREHALAAIGEGYCPQQHGPLAASAGNLPFSLRGEKPWPGGWCGQCYVWWRCDADNVITNYVVPADWHGVMLL